MSETPPPPPKKKRSVSGKTQQSQQPLFRSYVANNLYRISQADIHDTRKTDHDVQLCKGAHSS